MYHIVYSPAPASPFDKFRICRVTPYGIIVSDPYTTFISRHCVEGDNPSLHIRHPHSNFHLPTYQMHLRTGLLACSKTDCMSEKSRRSISVIISSVYKCPLGDIPRGYRIVIPKREAHRLKLPVAYRKLIAAMIGYLRQTGDVWQWPRTMYIPNKYMPLPTTNSPPSFPSADPVMYMMYSRPII